MFFFVEVFMTVENIHIESPFDHIWLQLYFIISIYFIFLQNPLFR